MSTDHPSEVKTEAASAAGAAQPLRPRPIGPITHASTSNFASGLAQLRASLLVSTYQAGKLVVGRTAGNELQLAYHGFEQPMGIAISPQQLAVATHSQIWLLQSSPDIAPRINPPGTYDGCYLSRSCHVTGQIRSHEIEWSGQELWIVNTLFSCLCTLSPRHDFVPRWKPRFVSTLAAEDRCHLNGLALENGRPRFVTCLGETDTRDGWRPGKAAGGCLIDVQSGQIMVRGLSMPHSPRIHQGRVWLVESGRGRLVVADLRTGQVEPVAILPGYARGLTFLGGYAFIGLSKIRQTATSAGLPIAADLDSLKCGVAVVDVTAGAVVALLEWQSGIEEIFDVRLDPHCHSPFLSGPQAVLDGTHPVWLVPPPRYDIAAH